MNAFTVSLATQAPASLPAGAAPAHEPGGWWASAQSADGRLLGALHGLPEQGRSRARFSFHLGRVLHSAPELGLHQVQTSLQLGHDSMGEAELSGLYLADDAPPAVADALLQAALQRLAQGEGEVLGPGVTQGVGAGAGQAAGQDRTCASWVIVELPGWHDASGRSPFWDGLVQHFLPAGSMDLAQGLQRYGPAFASHLGAMLPRQLIHTAFLSEAAQQALGRCADSHAPWLAALQRAGFADWRHCRIDDGGPLLARPRGVREGP